MTSHRDRASRSHRAGKQLGPLCAAALLVASLHHVRADASLPWADGVSSAQQDQANALFEEGNQLFAQQAHGPALARYKAAIAIWDHPMIHFNLAVAEIRLDRLLEASQDLEQALRFGQLPFTPALYHDARDYQRLLDGRIGDLEVSCEQTGVKVFLDGVSWFESPGKRKRRVLAGEHVIVGDRAGFLSSSVVLVATGGAVAVHRINLVSIAAATHLEYPYPRWMPWTIGGGGAAIVLGGLGLYLSGKNDLASFHSDFAQVCQMGCEAHLSDHAALRRERDSATLKGKIALSMMITGGAAIAVGVVVAIMNRPIQTLPRIEVAPAPGGAAASVRWDF